MDGIVPLFKSHYSLGKSILTLSLPEADYDPEVKKDTSDSIFEIALEKLDSKQYVFINKGKETIAATQHGLNRFNQS